MYYWIKLIRILWCYLFPYIHNLSVYRKLSENQTQNVLFRSDNKSPTFTLYKFVCGPFVSAKTWSRQQWKMTDNTCKTIKKHSKPLIHPKMRAYDVIFIDFCENERKVVTKVMNETPHDRQTVWSIMGRKKAEHRRDGKKTPQRRKKPKVWTNSPNQCHRPKACNCCNTTCHL